MDILKLYNIYKQYKLIFKITNKQNKNKIHNIIQNLVKLALMQISQNIIKRYNHDACCGDEP